MVISWERLLSTFAHVSVFLPLHLTWNWYQNPESSSPTDIVSLAEHLNILNLPLLTSQFLFNQLHPDGPAADKQPWESLPNIQSPILVFHSAHAIFYAPSDVSGSHGMHRRIGKNLL